MPTTTLDWIIVSIIVIAILGIFYKGLKEPIDLVLEWIKKLFVGTKNKLTSSGGETATIIKYG